MPRQATLSLDEAIYASVELEDAFMKAHLVFADAGGQPDLQTMFKTLAEADREHTARLKAYLDRMPDGDRAGVRWRWRVMKIVVLDGYALNPGDLSWDRLADLGELVVYDRTPAELTLARAAGAAYPDPQQGGSRCGGNGGLARFALHRRVGHRRQHH